MKKYDYLIIFGFIIYVILSIINKFILKIDSNIYIIVAGISLLIIIIGLIIRKKRN